MRRATTTPAAHPSWRADCLARATLDTVLQAVPLPSPFTMPAFVQRVATWRGRPISLVPAELDGYAPNGVVVSTADQDIVVYDAYTTELHARHTVAHELAHLICGHDGDPQPVVLRTVHPAPRLPGLVEAEPVDTVDTATWRGSRGGMRRYLHRASYDDEQEREAEFLASRLLTHVDLLHRQQAPFAQWMWRKVRRRPVDRPQPDWLVGAAGAGEPESQRLVSPVSVRPPSRLRRIADRREAGRLLRALSPLWQRLPHGTVADIVLPAEYDDPDRALYRRVVEIHDARRQLRPFVHPEMRRWARAAARQCVLAGPQAAVLIEAAELVCAIDAYADGRGLAPADAPPPMRPLVNPRPDVYTEAQTLIRLEQTMHTPTVVELARQATSDRHTTAVAGL